MRYIFFTYNLLTLCRAIRYTDAQFGKENTSIIYSDFVAKLPLSIQRDYSIQCVDSHSLNNGIRGLELVIRTSHVTNQIWRVIKQHIFESKEEVVLVLFRDNEVQETTWIHRAIKKYGSRVQIWLMEEGAGLYASKRSPLRYRHIKKLIYTIMGVSYESITNYTQGMNPNINKIICTKPKEFKNKRNEHSLVVEQMINIFVPDFNSYLIKSISGGGERFTKYDYVFLTQPFHDFQGQYDKLLGLHDSLLPQIFNILRRKGKTVIKLHPREHYDYERFVGNGVDMSAEEQQQLPFECLMELYGNPQMISMFSSVCINIKNSRPSIYLGELFEIPVVKELFDDEFYTVNNIVLCRSLAEFKSVISS